MGKKIVLLLVGIVVAALAIAWVYFNYFGTTAPMPQPLTQSTETPVSMPDNSVVAGLVSAVNANTITVLKQDGTSVTMTITASTTVSAAVSPGENTSKKVSDVQVNASVLVIPSVTDATIAQTIVLLPAVPAH